VPHVIAELKQGGIKDENIMFLGSFGSHCLMRQPEVRAKLGSDIVQRYPWVNHNCWENLVDVGETSRGNRVKVNHHFAKADLRVTVSGVKMHGQAGYGGGGKAVLPGVAWIESIDYNHRKIGGRGNKTTGACKIFKNEVRLDMVEAAQLAHVEFSVQAVLNGYRKLIGIYAGDIEKAHHEACRHANRVLRTEPIQGTDIAIANASPCAIHAYGYLSWLREVREGGSVVLIAQHPEAIEAMHFLTERQRFQPDKTYFEMENSEFQVKQAGLLIIYSSYLQARDLRRFQKGAVVTRTWADTVAALRKAHPSGARAVLYPYAGVQHRPIDLDG
jgi:nickel-dependent lactate racemase